MKKKKTGPKVFTLVEANKQLTEVASYLKTLKKQREQIHTLEAKMAVVELEGLREDGVPTAGARQASSSEAARMKMSMARFQKTLNDLDAMGCQLKDLDQGLVDFFTVHEGQLVFLCWKEGEDKIRFWHHLEDGFPGRRPVEELSKE
tara:strand:+ start:240 stop:680 length:441 start_codon:yes stop_codon:yes gene_type:complete